MLRRIAAIAFLLMAAAFLAATAGAEPVKLTVTATDATPGGKASVPILVEKPQGLGALQMVVTYDAKALEATGAEPGDAFAGLIESNVVAPGRLKVALITNEGVTADGEVAKLQFTVLGSGAIAIGIEDAKAWEQKTSHEMAVTAQGGTLTVKGGMSGLLPYLVGGAALVVLVIIIAALKRKKKPAAA